MVYDPFLWNDKMKITWGWGFVFCFFSKCFDKTVRQSASVVVKHAVSAKVVWMLNEFKPWTRLLVLKSSSPTSLLHLFPNFQFPHFLLQSNSDWDGKSLLHPVPGPVCIAEAWTCPFFLTFFFKEIIIAPPTSSHSRCHENISRLIRLIMASVSITVMWPVRAANERLSARLRSHLPVFVSAISASLLHRRFLLAFVIRHH